MSEIGIASHNDVLPAAARLLEPCLVGVLGCIIMVLCQSWLEPPALNKLPFKLRTSGGEDLAAGHANA
jgi:hypothetical protein